jgi:uncharacterized membrane protein YfcA
LETSIPVAAVIVIIFISTFTRSALGFGDAVLAMPLLAMLINLRTATPLVAFAASTISITILLGSWREVDFKAAWRLILSSLIGIPLGLYFLIHLPETLVKGVLGVVLILFGLYKLFDPRLPTYRNDLLAYVFGFLGGLLGGAYNTNGPPVVLYGALRGWSPESYRATLQAYFLPTGMTILIGHGLAGLWTPTVLKLYLYALPLILIAIFLGGRLNQYLSSEWFNRIIYAFLIVLGIILII